MIKKNCTLDQPAANSAGFVKTLNNMGFMTSSLDPYSQAFVDFSAHAPGPVLDIGAAYGVATLAALKSGARVIANDIDGRHLDILMNRVPISQKSHLKARVGKFPSNIHFKRGSLGAVLICRVLHFFEPLDIQIALECVYRWLAHGGKLFVVAETPYVGPFKKFIPIYEERRAQNDPWPGLLDVAKINPVLCQVLPEKMNLMDPDVLSREFMKADFNIEKVGTIARLDFPKNLQLDGRESVGIIGVKR